MADLARIDLNLFLVLHAVLTEGSATAAARRLHVTQSAVSNALARLRALYDDPLVVRSGRGLVPTPRARALAPFVESAVAALELALEDDPGFDPARSGRVFTLAAGDSQEGADLPRLVKAFTARLPKATLRVVSIDYLLATGGLESGEVDAVLAPPEAAGAGERSAPLYFESGAIVVRRDHPRVGARMSREQFNAESHVDVHLVLGRPGVGNRVAAAVLDEGGLARRVALIVPHFSAAAMAAARTDLVAALPSRLARTWCDFLPLRIVEGPFEALPRIGLSLVWHARTESDPACRYFRELIIETLREDDAAD